MNLITILECSYLMKFEWWKNLLPLNQLYSFVSCQLDKNINWTLNDAIHRLLSICFTLQLFNRHWFRMKAMKLQSQSVYSVSLWSIFCFTCAFFFFIFLPSLLSTCNRIACILEVDATFCEILGWFNKIKYLTFYLVQEGNELNEMAFESIDKICILQSDGVHISPESACPRGESAFQIYSPLKHMASLSLRCTLRDGLLFVCFLPAA